MKLRTLAVVGLLSMATLAVAIGAGRYVMAQRYGGYGPGMMWGDDYGPGWRGRHGGWGPGMMGGGPGMMWGAPGDWDDLDEYSDLPADKRAQLRDLSVETERKAISQHAAMRDQMIVYIQALQKFPIDRDAAAKAWQGMEAVRKQMFELRLDETAKAQQILGKDLWEKAQEGWGPGGRGPRGPR